MKPLHHLFCLSIAAVVAACASAPRHSAEESAYLESLRLRFPAPIAATVGSAEASAAWSRALEFATRYGDAIESANETLIRTVRRDSGFGWSFEAVKVPAGDSVKIAVRAGNPNISAPEHVARVARMYAAYIATGEMPFPDLRYE